MLPSSEEETVLGWVIERLHPGWMSGDGSYVTFREVLGYMAPASATVTLIMLFIISFYLFLILAVSDCLHRSG